MSYILDNKCMLFLNRKKFEELLKRRGLNISTISKLSNVSRQSIYSMFDKETVFNTAFEKLLAQLDVSYQDITEDIDKKTAILKNFPDKIKKIILKLLVWAEENHADLIIFGSRARGKIGITHDFDLGLFFHKKTSDKNFRLKRQALADEAFPYRVDIINLNGAPKWFSESIKDDMIYLRREKENDGKKTKGRS